MAKKAKFIPEFVTESLPYVEITGNYTQETARPSSSQPYDEDVHDLCHPEVLAANILMHLIS